MNKRRRYSIGELHGLENRLIHEDGFESSNLSGAST